MAVVIAAGRAVPIGVPLIAGPAVLTTVIIQLDSHGIFYTLLSLLVNLLIVGLIFLQAQFFLRLLGENGAKAISKIVSLLLAAIAVMMIRLGILSMIRVHSFT